MGTSPEFEEFQPLLDAHGDFAESLLSHQESLIRGDIGKACSTLRSLERELARHIAVEEDVLLPVVERGGGWTRIGNPAFYRQEHRRILDLLAKFASEAEGLDPDAPDLHRGIALLIGREHGLRTLLEHHDDRERQALYRDLLRLTTPVERRRLLERVEKKGDTRS